MSDMVERAARAILPSLDDGDADQYGWTMDEARRALLAAFDPEDTALVETIASAMWVSDKNNAGAWRDFVRSDFVAEAEALRSLARAAVSALKAQCAQGVPVGTEAKSVE